MKKFTIVFIALLAGCSSSLPMISDIDVTRAQTQWNGVTLEQLRSDRELYIVKCSGCHSLYTPSQYSNNEWSSILPTMNTKSKLSTIESERIKRYLSLFSAKTSL